MRWGRPVVCAVAAGAPTAVGALVASCEPLQALLRHAETRSKERRDFRRDGIDGSQRCHICAGTALAPATSAPGLGSPATRAPGLGSPRPHLRRDWAHPSRGLSASSGVFSRHRWVRKADNVTGPCAHPAAGHNAPARAGWGTAHSARCDCGRVVRGRWETNEPTNKQTNKQINKQTNKQINK